MNTFLMAVGLLVSLAVAAGGEDAWVEMSQEGREFLDARNDMGAKTATPTHAHEGMIGREGDREASDDVSDAHFEAMFAKQDDIKVGPFTTTRIYLQPCQSFNGIYYSFMST